MGFAAMGAKKAIIIGAGIGGLAAAVRLRLKGFDVQVFEANAYPGGKLSEILLGNYRFDAGPSLFTMPELVDELFVLAGKKPEDYFQYQRLDESCRYFFEDGTRIRAFDNRAQLLEELQTKTGEPVENIEKALHNSRFLFDSLSGLFMFRPIHKLSTWLAKEAFRTYLRIPRLSFFKTMAQTNDKRFLSPKLRQIFNRYATYNGSDPWQAPATLHIIPHLEFNKGAYFPKGGMNAITQSVYRLALDLGVNFRFNTAVSEILIEKGKAIGIKVGDESFIADTVISNMDMVNTYRKLLPGQYSPHKLLNQPKSSSALIFYWGIKAEFKELGLHNIFFSANYEAEFKAIFKDRRLFDDPTVYINITSKLKPDDAASASENWFVMINVPHNDNQDSDTLIADARKAILSKLSKALERNIEDLIEQEDYLDPRRIESRTSSFGGALYGNSSNTKYAAFLRHPNNAPKIKNLFFCGGSVHPGGGIPLSLLSAKQMADYYISLT